MNTGHLFSRLKEIGVTRWVVAPGSRSAPLILGAQMAGMPEPVIAADERSAAFVALGWAEQSGQPVAVITTSGSAAQNLGPAITEAFYRGLPLLALTADRPADRIGQEEGQSMPQPGLFNEITAARFSFVGEDEPETLDAAFPFLLKALGEGPVHINMAFREPLYEKPHPFSAAPLPALPPLNSSLPDFSKLKTSGKILILAGQLPPTFPKDSVGLFHQKHVPVVADITSNLPAAWVGLGNLAGKFSPDLLPDEVWILGRTLLWRQWGTFLSEQKNLKVFEIRPDGKCLQRFPQLPAETITTSFHDFLTYVKENVKGEEAYFRHFETAYHTIRENRRKMELSPESDLAFVRKLMHVLPQNVHLHLANSLSVRYADLFANQGFNSAVYANRGVSGIDGCLSTVVGHAIANPKQHHVLLIGDQALTYDNNGLWVNPRPTNLTIVLLNNQGGQIFNVIQGPSTVQGYEKSFLNSENRSFEWMASRYQLPYQQIHHPDELTDSLLLQAPGLIEIKTEPEEGRKDFRTLQEW